MDDSMYPLDAVRPLAHSLRSTALSWHDADHRLVEKFAEEMTMQDFIDAAEDQRERTLREQARMMAAFMNEKLVKEFPHRSQVTRPLTAPNTVQVFVEHSIFPESGLSWVFNLTLTVLTLGSWLLIYAVWAVLKVGETKKWTKVSAYPRDEEGFSRIHLEGNREDWFSVVSGWLTEKYSPQEA